LNFSFSGLKTSILYFLRDSEKATPGFREDHLEDICASVQHTIIQILLEKLEKAAEQTGIREIAIAGGVSANSGLRKALQEKAAERSWTVHIPAMEFCTDNAAMIGISGYYRYRHGLFADLGMTPEPRSLL